MNVGIAGLDEMPRIKTAHLGVAGEVKGETAIGARFGIAEEETLRVAGMGIAGNMNDQAIGYASQIASLRQYDASLSSITHRSTRLGDRAALTAWKRGVWMLDFTYICSPFAGDTRGVVSWKKGRQAVFSRPNRLLPLFLDSCGFRARLTGTAPKWAQVFEHYPAAIELLDPDGYAAWDYPHDRAKTLEYTRRLMSIFPNDPRLWPVFSVRWAWDDNAYLDYAMLRGWRTESFARLIPQNKTQRKYKEETRERWARLAIANALNIAKDPDFLWMVNTFGQVMLGGMVQGPCPRTARHLFAATLCHLFPETQFWLLGQANFLVVNGLGCLGLLDRVWCDGTWWIKDSTCERFAIVEDGLITMLSLESSTKQKERRKRGEPRRQSFFTLVEMMAANLRALLAAYEGLWAWPPPEPLPLDLVDIGQAMELKRRYQAAQLELGL